MTHKYIDFADLHKRAYSMDWETWRHKMGPEVWDLYDDVTEHGIGCDDCRGKMQKALSGMHDIVNIKKGECPEQPQNLQFLKTMADKAWEIYSHKPTCSNIGNKSCHGKRCMGAN
jgi:hypothetical protein